jgi:predicted GIY-YIG superfamily endonuclease
MESRKYWVYVLELEDGRKYVGHTNNIKRRLLEHQSGRSAYTKKFGIKRLLYSEVLDSRSAAMKKEKFLKSGKGREWLKSNWHSNAP